MGFSTGSGGGTGGSGQNVDFSQVTNGSVPLYDSSSGKYIDSGIKKLTDDNGNEVVLLPEGTGIESASLDIGERISVGESGSFIVNRNKFDNKSYFVLDYLIDQSTGSATPVMMDVGGEQTTVVQPLFGSIITGTSVSASFTSTQMNLISEVMFKVSSMMTNVRVRVIDVATGKAFRYWPGKADWFANEGETWAAGDKSIDLSKSTIQIPTAGVQVRLDIRADSLSLLGNAGVPYLAIKNQTGQFTTMATRPWVQTTVAAAVSAAINNTYDPLDTTRAVTGAATESRITALKSEIDAGVYMGTWNATTNTPTLQATPTQNQGEFYEVSTAGTRFGITFAVGDLIICGVNTGGTKTWYKRAYNAGVFDSRSVYVSQTAGNDSYSGAESRRKATVAGALAVVGQPGSIDLASGAYSIGALTVNKTNVNFIGKGSNANNSVEFTGQMTTTAGRVRLRNINFTQGAGSAFTWGDSVGGHHIQDISTTVGQTGPVFTGSAAASGVLSTISNGDLSGSVAANNIVLENRASGVAALYLVNLANVRISVGTGWVVYVNACPDIQITGNTAGVFWVDGITVLAILTSQAQLNAVLADTNTATDGYYICDFANPSVGARNDLLLKKSVQGVATNVKVNRPYTQCPATLAVLTGSVFETYNKRAGGWVPPANRTTDTSAFFVTKVTPAMGSPASPYQLVAGDSVVQVDNSGPVGLRLAPVSSLATASQTRRVTISCPRAMSSQTVALFTSGVDAIVGGPMGHPNGTTTLYLTPGDSVTLMTSVDAGAGNSWVIESITSYDPGASYYWGVLSTNTVLTSWGGYWHVDASAGNVALVMPMSTFGKPGSHIKLIRTDTSNNTVTIAGASGYTINGKSSIALKVGESVVVSTHTSGNQALRAEYSATTPVRCVMTTSGASVTISSLWGFQGCPFSNAQTAFVKSDPYGMHNQATPTRVYAPVAGMYKLSGSYRLDNTSGAQLCGIRYFKNGVATNNEFFHPVVGNVILQADFTANMYLAAGDYVEMGIYADTFKTLGIWTGNFSVELM